MATSKRKTDDRRRPERVASRVREELASLLTRELADPRLSLVVISRVHVTDDLSMVRVGISTLDDDASQAHAKAAVKVLASITPSLRAKLAPKLGMRRVPVLQFVVATSADEAGRLDALLAEVSHDLQGAKDAKSASAPAAAASPERDDDEER
jgi:ribosome-binding factor A